MKTDGKDNPPDHRSEFIRQVEASEKRRIRAEKQKSGLWSGIGIYGIVGWSVAITTLLGTAVGMWLDTHVPMHFSWTLTLLLGGLFLGCINAWNWIEAQSRKIRESQLNHGEEDPHE